MDYHLIIKGVRVMIDFMLFSLMAWAWIIFIVIIYKWVKEQGGVKLNKTLILIAIILIALGGFSIKTNSFEFEWLGVLETIIRIFKQFAIQKY